MTLDARGIWEQVKANNRALEACPRHRFARRQEYTLGEKETCLECGGQIRLADLGFYIRGYVAAGGNANDIIPGYGDEQQPTKGREG